MPEKHGSHQLNRMDPHWSRRGVLATAAVAGAGALTGGLTGCSGGSEESSDKLKEKIDNPSKNLNKEGFPIVKDPITVQFMTGKSPNVANDWNKVAAWKKYQDMTNIKIKWGLVQYDSRDEKRNLALSGGDYPEAFHNGGPSVRDLGKYGAQGVFLRLNELIDEYMPNLKKLMDENPDIRKGVTFPNGKIYGAPLIYDPNFTALRINYTPWVRGDWLDKFDMEVPTTTDEYYKYLKKVKSRQPNGSGNTIPYGSFHGGEHLYAALRGSFGVGNRTAAYVDADPADEDKVRFFPIADGYKALMEYLHRLYDDGLIAKNIFSLDESKGLNALNKGSFGSTVEIAPYNLAGGQAKKFVPMAALKGPNGDQKYNNVTPSLLGLGNFVITDKCKHPVEIARWEDYFYSDDGVKLYFMGVKGKSYKETSDGVEYLDKITDPPDGTSPDKARKPYVTYMGGDEGGIIIKQEYFKGAESSDESVKGAKLMEPYAREAVKNAWPAFTFTEDEFQRLESLADDIQKYVDESRDKFISGDLKLSKWQTYVEKIKKMGLDDYLEIQQAAYDRYRKN